MSAMDKETKEALLLAINGIECDTPTKDTDSDLSTYWLHKFVDIYSDGHCEEVEGSEFASIQRMAVNQICKMIIRNEVKL